MHFKHFSKDLMSVHVWRQTQTQSTIINFYEEDMNIFNPSRNDRGNTDGIFRMEFPLMQWIVACGYKLFGNRLIISRGFMFLIGLFSVLGIYFLLNNLFHNEHLALIGAWAFNFSPCFYYYTINPLPDNLALCCAIWGTSLFFSWYNNKRMSNLIFSGLFISVAALCKLPFIVFYIIPFIFFVRSVYEYGLKKETTYQFISIFSFAILPLAWYISVIPDWHGNPIVKGLFHNTDSIYGLLDYLQFNLISTLPELLLNYGSLPLFLVGGWFLFKRKSYKDPKFVLILGLSLIVLFYFLFELNAIARIHDYYLFPFYPLLFILVAYGAYNMLISKYVTLRYLTIFLLIILPFTCYMRMKGRWDPEKPGFNKDLLTYKNELRNAVPKDALVVAGNDKSHFILFYYIDKKGWGFHDDNLTSNALKKMIDKGAKYLYTDSKEVVAKKDIEGYLDKLILEKGTIKIFSLKESR